MAVQETLRHHWPIQADFVALTESDNLMGTITLTAGQGGQVQPMAVEFEIPIDQLVMCITPPKLVMLMNWAQGSLADYDLDAPTIPINGETFSIESSLTAHPGHPSLASQSLLANPVFASTAHEPGVNSQHKTCS